MIHKPALGRIDTINITPDIARRVFIGLAEAALEHESDCMVLEYSFDDPNEDEYELGEFVPQILFQVRRIVPEAEEQPDDPPVEQQL